MNLKNILKILGYLSLTTLSYARNHDFTGECDDLANTFAAHENGSYDDLFQCEVNDNGKVEYLILGYIPNEEIGQLYIEDIGNLKELKNLCLYDVVFEGMDFEPFKKIETLEKINIDVYYKNPLTSIPETFYNLTNLKNLSIEVQKITSISDKIGNLENLEYLFLTSMPITEIPKSISKLTKLKTLDLGGTDITKFPKEIADLKNLEKLQLDNCKIDDEIPASYNNLKNLKSIAFAGNKNIKGRTLTIDLEECYYGEGYKDLCIEKRTSCLLRNKELKLCNGEVDDPIKVSTDGTCGDEKYTKCPEGQCCSKYGWCGTSEKHCSTALGCQSEFGKCIYKEISKNDRCGKEYGYCPSGKCCSKYGWCGTSKAYCERSNGCQSEFGRCNGSDEVPVNTEGKCGKEYGNCRKGECCSRYGWCGTDDDYCGAGCQSEFGTCK